MDPQPQEPAPPGWSGPAISSLTMAGLAVLLFLQLFLVSARTRWIADDFIMAVNVRETSLLEASAEHYREWSGRYAATFSILAILSFGPRAAPWFSFLLLLLSAAACLVSAYRWSRSIAVMAALGLMLALSFASIPDPYQTLYWVSGAATYTLPFAVVLVWTAFRSAIGSNGTAAALLALILGFMLAGFSETFTASMLFVIATAVVADRVRRAEWVSCAAGLLLGAAAMFLAPGNSVRSAHFHQEMTPGMILGRWADLGVVFAQRELEVWQVLAAAAALGFSAGAHLPHSLGTRSVIMGLAISGAAAVSLFPAAAMLGLQVPERVISVPHVLLLFGVAILFALPGSRWRWGSHSGVKRALIVTVAVLAFLSSQPRIVGLAQAMTQRADMWDSANDRLSSESREANVAMEVPYHVGGLVFLAPDPEHDVNEAVARWHGVKSVRAVKPPR